MKNYAFTKMLAIVAASLSLSFSPATSTHQGQHPQNVVNGKGYLFGQGGTELVHLTFFQDQYGLYGLKVYQWKLDKGAPLGAGGGMSSGSGGSAPLIPLNPQHQLAVKYNFTHYTSLSCGNVYLNVYSDIYR